MRSFDIQQINMGSHMNMTISCHIPAPIIVEGRTRTRLIYKACLFAASQKVIHFTNTGGIYNGKL